jgi:hypothetical protein
MLDAQRTVSIVLVVFALALALFLIIRKLHRSNVEQEAESKSGRRKRNSGASEFNSYRIVPYAMLVFGLVSLIGSAFSGSYVPALIGLGLTFWGALLLYLTPTKYVNLELLNATASSSLANIERTLSNTETTGKGVYLPPKRLKDYQSSIVFIPRKANDPLPEPEETDQERLHSKNPGGILLTPPGLALSRLFENKLGTSFTETDLPHLQKTLPKLLAELEITKKLSIQVEDNTVTVEVANHIFKDLCEETKKLPKTQEAVGCPLSSAIACALAKASGKPVTIEKEMQNLDGSTRIQYKLLED